MDTLKQFTGQQHSNMDLSAWQIPDKSSASEISASYLPIWAMWFSTIVLTITFIIGLPLNALTVLIFVRRKKLRHLVNFVLLLDCLSHILLCLVAIPIQTVTVWSGSYLVEPMTSDWLGLHCLQQVVRNFSNLYGTLLALSIAILRYRRLCWKKKDKFCTQNALKWTVSSGVPAVGLTLVQSWTGLQLHTLANPNRVARVDDGADSEIQNNDTAFQETERFAVLLFSIKLSLVLVSMLVIFFSYIRVSQRLWANAASQEQVMDPSKRRKSRSVHLRATIHSCVQVLLVLLTLSPHLYEETWQARHFSTRQPLSPTAPDPSRLARLLGLTLNYTLLVLGTPIAYIASCHRFREQFTSILVGNMSFTRQIFRKLTPSSGGTGGQRPGLAQRTSAPLRHLVMNHNNNHIGHRLIKLRQPSAARLSTAHKVSGTSSTRSSSLNSSSTGGRSGSGTRLGFSAKPNNVNVHQTHLQQVTKATTEIISTLSLHHFQQHAKLVLETSQSTSSSASSMDSGFSSKPKGALPSEQEQEVASRFSRKASLDQPAQPTPLTSATRACSYYNCPQLITYSHSPSDSMSEIYGCKV